MPGQTAAMDAGFRHALESYVVSMDADMQNDPWSYPEITLKKLNTYDMVCGWRQKRNDPWIKRISSQVAQLYFETSFQGRMWGIQGVPSKSISQGMSRSYQVI